MTNSAQKDAPAASCLLGFQEWIADLRRGGLAKSTSNMVIGIDEVVARRFCIGLAENKVFFGIQDRELEWFSGLPWLHVAVKKGGKKMAFVSEETTAGGVSLPSFAISFEAGDKVGLISRCQYLDIRKIEVNDDGCVVAISKRILTTVDVYHVIDDESIAELRGGRITSGYSTRSPYSGAIKK
jgi:hypothetical protein